MKLRRFVVRAAIQEPAGGCFANTTPLLEEESDSVATTNLVNVFHPAFLHRACPCAAFTDHDCPVDAGDLKLSFMDAARFDRQETYNVNLRQWHFRIAEELIGYKFDAASIQKPLLLMVGEQDDYPMVHFLQYVKTFAGSLVGPGQALTVQQTGHSIQSERPAFLAAQILRFAR